MEKYQVFLSSVSKGLEGERQMLIQSLLMSNKYFPIAMEHFTSQGNIILMIYRYLRDSDFYVVMIKDGVGDPIGPRHGGCLRDLMKAEPVVDASIRRLTASLAVEPEDLSFTQVEYAMAQALGIECLGFVFDSGDPRRMKARRKLLDKTDPTFKFDPWTSPTDLQSKVGAALSTCIDHDPGKAAGWIRKADSPLYTATRAAGITRISADGRSFRETFLHKVVTSTELDLFFTTGLGFILASQGPLSSYVAGGGKIRLLCGAPSSQFLSDLAEAEQAQFGDRSDLHTEFSIVTDTLKHVMIRAQRLHAGQGRTNPLGSIQVGNYGTLFRSSVLICKYPDHRRWGWLTITTPPEKSADLPSFELISPSFTEDQSDNLMNKLESHFEQVWEIAARRNTIRTITPDAALPPPAPPRKAPAPVVPPKKVIRLTVKKEKR
jgi:hypothetical protein